ncbi:MAG TPA: hypothetical protein VN894_00960 [Polyangiaceae bacterium]|nr:hypothetical protein [Polyangiaceae bacterium]
MPFAGLGLAAAMAFAGALAGCASDDGSATQNGSADASADQLLSGDGPVYTLGGGKEAGPRADGPSGGGIAAFSSGFVDFGEVECGGLAALQTLTIVNNGTDPLSASAMTTGTAFSVSPAMLSVPGGGQTADFTITATVPGSATAGDPLTGSLNLVTSDPSQASFMVPLTVTPAGATIKLQSPSGPVAFPESEVGQSAPDQFFILANGGNAPATLAVSAPSNPRFLLVAEPDAGVTLNPGDTWTGTVGFTPPDTTVASATSTVTIRGTTCGTNVTSISFSGQGAYGQVTGWPTAPVDFGPATCGGSAPAPQSFQLTNGSMVDARITSVALAPPTSGFATDAVVGKFIAANGGSRTIRVTAPPVPALSPLAPITATLTLETDADSSPHTITLQEDPQGAVLAFDTSATPNFGSFGQVLLLTSATQSFSVKNTGNAPAMVTLGLGSAAPAGGGSDGGSDAGPDATVALAPASPFAISDTSFSIDPHATQTDAVTFVPATGTSYGDTIAIATTSPLCSALPSSPALTGVGMGGGPSLSASALNFSATCGGGAPGPQSIVITNRGVADMSWSAGPITGPGAAEYAMFPYPASGQLAPGDGTILQVTAAAIPSPAPNPDPAALTAQFSITTDVPLDNPHVVALTETPIGDRLSFSVQTLRFGQYPIDHMTPMQTFTVTNAANPGSPAANVSLALTGAGGAVYVEPEDGGAVCIVPGDGAAADSAGACIVPSDGGDGGEAGDGGDGGDSGPEYVAFGYVFASPAVQNLAPGGGVSAPSSVTFIPTTAAPYPATIAIQTYDALCSALPAPIQLSGTGTQGQVSISPTTLAFGTDPADPLGLVNCGATGLPQTINVTSTGNQTFHIVGLSLGAGTHSPYDLSGLGATLPATVPIGGAVPITVTPHAIPANVVNPNDPSPFSDTLTITTDAVFDVPHNVSLVMQARGAVIADRPLNRAWSFGTITVGSIGTFTTSIENDGNATASLGLQGLMDPTVFFLQNNPTTLAPNTSTAFVGQFVPPTANGSWTDQGTLVVTTPQVFCQPLPAAWNSPTIALSGSSSATPPVSVAGSLDFPSSDCGSAAPAGQAVTITNNTNQPLTYTLGFNRGDFYSITDPGPGTIAGNGTATVLVAPNSVAPAQGVKTGSAPYADGLVVSALPAGASVATSKTVPITWTLDGAVLSLPEGAGPKADGLGNAFYPADTTTGYALPMDNNGTKAATVTFGIQPSNVFTFSPPPPTPVPAAGHASLGLASTASDSACPATTSATATFFYTGPVCQPFQQSQVNVHACKGTFH